MSNVYSKMNIPKDECYTTKNESDKLIRYLEEQKIIDHELIIWLPFDNELSNIYKSLQWGGGIKCY